MTITAANLPPAEEKDPVASIAGQITKLSSGDRAALRRIYLTRRHDADGVVIGLLHRAGVPIPTQADTFARWRLLAHAAALLSGTGAVQSHAPKRRVGTALQAAGYSENRLMRLTTARGAAVYDQVVRAARMLAQGGQAPINLHDLFDLVANDAVRVEEARLRIAQSYYAALARSEGDTK